MKLEKAVWLMSEIFEEVYPLRDKNRERFRSDLKKFLNNFINEEEQLL